MPKTSSYLFLSIGFVRSQLKRKVTIKGVSGLKFNKQADIIVFVDGLPGMVVETKRITHRLRAEDANQALSYAQLLGQAAPYAILTNGHTWELYNLLNDSIGGIDDIPSPQALSAAVASASKIPISLATKEAAERLLVTIENKEALEQAFARCRQALAREGLIAESAFDELTKILVCKFNEEKRLSDQLGEFRFSSAWFKGEGWLNGLIRLFADAKVTFHVFPPNTEIAIRNNSTVQEIVQAIERFGFYGFKTPVGLAGAGGDVVGSVYETFLTGTLRGDLGQYLTPRQLIEFMVELADPQIGESIGLIVRERRVLNPILR